MADHKRTLIFIVDDDPLQRELLKDHLKKKTRCNIQTFANGEECIAQLIQKPSIIFLDYELNPSDNDFTNGLDVLKAVKAKYPPVEIVMFSGQEKIEVAVNTMVNGAFDYIIKNESAFVRAENIINNILEGKHLKSQNAMYKAVVIGMGILIAVMAIGTFVAYHMGYISDRHVGGAMF